MGNTDSTPSNDLTSGMHARLQAFERWLHSRGHPSPRVLAPPPLAAHVPIASSLGSIPIPSNAQSTLAVGNLDGRLNILCEQITHERMNG